MTGRECSWDERLAILKCNILALEFKVECQLSCKMTISFSISHYPNHFSLHLNIFYIRYIGYSVVRVFLLCATTYSTVIHILCWLVSGVEGVASSLILLTSYVKYWYPHYKILLEVAFIIKSTHAWGSVKKHLYLQHSNEM